MGDRSLPRNVLKRRRRPARIRDARSLLAAAALIVAITIVVFAPVRSFDFVNYDDLDFVVENPHVASGLTADNIRWAFANAYAATGGPLTWISHMLDVERSGLDPGAHHVTSLVIHILNACLLLVVLTKLTGAPGRSAFVAALFAVHPLHVESVAWVSERKDVLSTLFWLLTMWAYVWFTNRRTVMRYGVVVMCFGLGLLAKPMVATLPFVLLLLDLWPLGRLPLGTDFWTRARALTLEKVPLLVLAAPSIAFTLVAQRRIGAVATFDLLPLPARLANAVVSYVDYIYKMSWPSGLTAFYPFRESPPATFIAGCAAALLALTVTAIVTVRRAPYLAVGWMWYVGTLVPVIGIVQVGGHAMADRFTYIPLIGLFIASAWCGLAVLERTGLPRPAIIATAGILVAACAVTARGQVLHWANGIALWQHATRVYPDGARAHANLGVALARDGRSGAAIAEYETALRFDPRSAETHNNLALALVGQRDADRALPHYVEAIRLNPDYANAHTNLANLLDDRGQTGEAIAHYREAIRISPDRVLARMNLAIALAKRGALTEAIAELETVVRLEPGNQDARKMLDALRRPTS